MSPDQKSSTPIVNVGPDVELKNANPTITANLTMTSEDKRNYTILLRQISACRKRENFFKEELSNYDSEIEHISNLIQRAIPNAIKDDRFRNFVSKLHDKLDKLKISKESIETEYEDCKYLEKKLKEMEENPKNKLYLDALKKVLTTRRAERASRSKLGGGVFGSKFLKSNKNKKPVIKTEELNAEELAELEKMIQEEEERAALADAKRIQSLINKPLPGSVTLTPEQEALELAELEKLANNGGTRKRRKYKKYKKHKKHKKTLNKKY
jgi:DNA polymerase III alpha subunit (gram-positive type)